MRGAILIAVVACGPVKEPAVAQPTNAWDTTPNAPEPPKPPAKQIEAPPDAAVVAEQPDAAIAPAVSWEDTQPDASGVDTDANGVTFVHAKTQAWCIKGGKADSVCGAESDCSKLTADNGGRCAKSNAWACTSWVLATTGRQKLLCLSTFGKCTEFARQLTADAEVSNVMQCAIFRYP